MLNAVKRDIPEALLAGRTGYQGKYAKDGQSLHKAAPTITQALKPQKSKLADSLKAACEACGAHDGMTFSFHTEYRNGDKVAAMAAKVLIEDLGLKDITVAATSLGDAQANMAQYIKNGQITGVQTSGVRGVIGEAISAGELQTPAIIRSHGGRPRAIAAGEVHIDIAFLAAASSDAFGNASGIRGKNNCGSMGFAIDDAHYADHVIVVTDTLVDFPNVPAAINGVDVDAVCVVDQVGDPSKIATKEARMTQDPRELMMAQAVAKVIAASPDFKDGFSFQTGVGGPSLAVNRYLEQYMTQRQIKMSFALGGTSKAICDLQDKGLVNYILDTQDFDQGAVAHFATHPNHLECSLDQYASPANKGAFVNNLDFVVLSALEVDVDFNVNVVTGSDGVLRGAPGGHPDTAAGSKCCIIVTPLTRGRMPTVCDAVVTVTTPGDSVDVVVTDYGIAVNPQRQDIIAQLDAANIAHTTIEALRDKAYALVGTPAPLEWQKRVVAVVEGRDGSIVDVVRQVKPFAF
ncbi:citrate lyase subunit alpha [Lacticaseibacillus baoqingensis]|uniref:Citrate lyase alpha chain n=1 Tax=Lacticaseibacillus baoqingensis TaxID=2486013 RepID=A0ABW4E6M0_9LACO|nr:citrate lyase subunit alpha [Lacticaseibacillus baoqingensis]